MLEQILGLFSAYLAMFLPVTLGLAFFSFDVQCMIVSCILIPITLIFVNSLIITIANGFIAKLEFKECE